MATTILQKKPVLEQPAASGTEQETEKNGTKRGKKGFALHQKRIVDRRELRTCKKVKKMEGCLPGGRCPGKRLKGSEKKEEGGGICKRVYT